MATPSPTDLSPIPTANSDDILHDLFPVLREYRDGRIERFNGELFTPASVDPDTGVQSKDVVISSEINLGARLYLPKDAIPENKLPLVVYFHGGGFVIESAFSPLYQKHLNLLVAEANVVALSVDYRLAPEYHLPVAYEDSWLALKWAADQFVKSENCEPWIKDYVHPDRVFLGGDSPGGNIAHNVAMRFGSEKLEGINLSGMFLNGALFRGEDAIGTELERQDLFTKAYLDKIWTYACPSSIGCDDPRVNPSKDPKLSSLGCNKVILFVAERDFFKDRGYYYRESLIKSGWKGKVEMVEVEGVDHGFSVFSPESEGGKAMFKRVATFLNE